MKTATPALQAQSHKPRGMDDKVFDTIALIVCLLILLVVVYPLWYVIICSFSDPNAVTGGQVIWLPSDREGRSRWRDNSIRPKRVILSIWTRALS